MKKNPGAKPPTNAPAPLSEAIRTKLAALVKDAGEEPTRKRIGLARDTFARALGGLTISRGSSVIIAQALAGKAGGA